MKRGAPDHPKMRRLARALVPALGISREIADLVAPGLMERFFHWVSTYAPTGDLTAIDSIDLAEGVRWPADGEALVAVLSECGWLDAEGGSLLVHDWHDHADDATKKKLERTGESFASGRRARRERVATPENEHRDGVATDSRQDRDGVAPAFPLPSSPSPSSPSPSSPEPVPGQEPRRAARAAPKTPAPDALSSEEQIALAHWCRDTLERPDLVPRLAALVDACFTFHRGKGNRHASWYATAQTWIRNEAEGRFGAPRASPAAQRDAVAEAIERQERTRRENLGMT